MHPSRSRDLSPETGRFGMTVTSVEDAETKIAVWRSDYNCERRPGPSARANCHSYGATKSI